MNFNLVNVLYLCHLLLLKARHCRWIGQQKINKNKMYRLTQLIDYIDKCKHFLYYKSSKMLGLAMQMSNYLMKYALICIYF